MSPSAVPSFVPKNCRGWIIYNTRTDKFMVYWNDHTGTWSDEIGDANLSPMFLKTQKELVKEFISAYEWEQRELKHIILVSAYGDTIKRTVDSVDFTWTAPMKRFFDYGTGTRRRRWTAPRQTTGDMSGSPGAM